MKKTAAWILCACLCLFLLCPVVSAQAAELNSFLTFHEIVTEEDQSNLLIYSTALPENGKLTLSIDSQQIFDPALTTVRQEKLPTTVYCLVDISTHMSQQQIQQQQDILNIISSRMSDEDSMVITTVGSKTIEGAVLDSLEARKTAIATLKRDGTKADMYRAIVDAMTSLEQKTTYCTNRCLLILSDGNLSSDSGTTEQQAMNTVNATSIPVYAIGITGDSAASYYVENARHMLKMAEVSTGGIGLIPAQENISAADAAQQVWENIQESAVMKIDLASVTSTSNNATVRAKYELGDTRLEDSITVDLTAVAVSDSTAQAASIEPTVGSEELNPAPQPSAADWIQEHLILVVGCAAAVLVVIAAVTIVIVKSNARKKREQARMEAGSKAIEVSSAMPESGSGVDTVFSTSDLDNSVDGYAPTQCVSQGHSSTAPVASDEGITVQMIVKSHPDVSISFVLAPHKQQVLGRDDRADIIVNADDYQLSGKHCLVEWDGNYLYIQDMGSTNGTVLNGISLKPDAWSRLNTGSILHMGSFDYHVVFQK